MSTNLVILQSYTESIDPGEFRLIHAYSRQLTIIANSASDHISVGIGDSTPTPLKAGLQYALPEGENFDRLSFLNESGQTTEVEFILSVGEIKDNRLVLSGSVFSDLLEQMQGDTTFETYAGMLVGVAYGQALASNTDRKGFSIQAKSTNSGKIYVGFDSLVTTSKWVAELQSGMSFGLDNYRGVVTVIADTANQNIGIGEW